MAQFNIEKISLSCKEREKEDQKKLNRRKTILVLIHHYLKEYGFIQAASVLSSEVNFDVNGYVVCDNIHLESVIQDFESYYFLKYQKHPQIMKKVPEAIEKGVSKKCRNSSFQKILKLSSHDQNKSTDDGKKYEKNALRSSEIPYKTIGEMADHNLELLGSFENYNKDWKSMAEIILQSMPVVNKHIKWDDIVGHDEAKKLLKEAIIYPIKYKELFSTSISPWRSMLLYGPSGTGKTLLASAAASESGAMFFKICISTIISKWRGESEKLIKVLFDLARHYAPSIIFIDEIDALLSHRGDDHEASRRMKTELFLQLDSLFSTDKLVFVLSATNMPWQLDYAILRRLEKRILISLPDYDSRMQLFQKFLSKAFKITENIEMKMNLDYKKLAEMTKIYSASDLEIVCKEAKMNYIRQMIKAIEFKPSARQTVLTTTIQPLNTSDLLQIIDKVKPSASELYSKYKEWQLKHGSE